VFRSAVDSTLKSELCQSIVFGCFRSHFARVGNLITGQQEHYGGRVARRVIEALAA
jgi:hypothetical protein